MLEMLQAVEPPVFYAIVGVIVLAVASLFGLVLFASREETFEDVVAKQRKAQEALLNSLQSGSAKTGKQNRKWSKLKNKKASKVKEQEENEIDSGVDDDEPCPESVNVSAPPPPITTEEPPPPPPPTAAKKKKKGKKNKGQQQEIPVIISEENIAEEHKNAIPEEEDATAIEEVAVEEDPVEEELILSSSNDDVNAAPEIPSDDEVAVEDNASVDDIHVESTKEEIITQEIEVLDYAEPITEIVEPAAYTPAPEPDKAVVEKSRSSKKKSSHKAGGQKKGVVTYTVEKLEADIETCHLNADEVQQVMDALLKKQNSLEQWQKPNQKSDPMEQMKKRIAEAEMQFAEERQSAQAIASKNKELRTELQQERNHRQSIQTEANNRIGQQAKETESIRKRMEEKHMSEMHSAQSQISRMQGIIDEGSNHHMELQRLKEDNGHLKNASMMAQQLAEDKQSLMAELSQLQQSNKSLRQELDNIILHNKQELQNLQISKVDSENALSQRLQEVNEQLMKVEAHNRSMQQQVEVAEQCKAELETYQKAAKPDEVEELNSKLMQIQTKFNDSESSVKILQEHSQVKNKEFEETFANLNDARSKLAHAESKLAEQEAEKNIEPVSEEVANLVAKVVEKDQMILVLEQKVNALECQGNNGQYSPDLVVVTPRDLLGSEPMLTSESFEEVSAYKDFEDVVDNKVPAETTTEESVLVHACESEESGKCVKDLEIEIEERKILEKSLQDALTKVKAEQEKAKEKLHEVQHMLTEKDATIARKESDIAERNAEIAEKVAVILVNEDAIAIKEDEIANKEAIIAEHESALGASKNTIIDKDSTIAENVLKIFNLETTLSENSVAVAGQDATSDLNKLILKKDELIKELKEKALKMEEVSSSGGDAKELLDKLNIAKDQLKANMDATELIKEKNNELREKNWKVIDALGKAESTSLEKLKLIERSICKGLKHMFPHINIPKYGDDIDMLFKSFGEKVAESAALKSAESEGEMSKTKEVNEVQLEEIKELKKTNELMHASQDEVLKSQDENVHLKNVLTETESMLSRLQTGVDAEVQKWQKKVNDKNAELEVSKKCNQDLKLELTKQGGDKEAVSTLESNLSDASTQLVSEKEENTKIKTEVQELEKNLADAHKQLKKEQDEYTQKLQEIQESAKSTTSDNEVAELNTKLKKTISERDLLIREYKSVKDNKALVDADLKATKDSLHTKTQSSVALTKEVEHLKAQIKTLGNSPNTTDKTLTEKTELINKLNLEIEELKEELREDRDCVIVDIDPDNAENLHKQVEVLSTELESEKKRKASLASKLHDIEKSHQEESSESDKVLQLQTKLKSAEQRIVELEADSNNPSQKTTRQDADESTSAKSV